MPGVLCALLQECAAWRRALLLLLHALLLVAPSCCCPVDARRVLAGLLLLPLLLLLLPLLWVACGVSCRCDTCICLLITSCINNSSSNTNQHISYVFSD